MLNRTVPPAIHRVENLRLPTPHKHTLSNGIPVLEINLGTQDITKIEVLFHVGRPYEQQRLVSRTTARMLREGSRHYSGADIAEKVDFYGGTISTPSNMDTSSVVLYSLNKHLEQLLPYLAEVVSQPLFPQDELDVFVKNSIQQLKVNLTKGDIVAYRELTEKIFTEQHPYGYNSTPEDYEKLRSEDLFRHFQAHYHAGNCTILVCGKTTTRTIELLDKYLGNTIPKGVSATPLIPATNTSPQVLEIAMPEASQTAIRIGCRLFTRRHPDYLDLSVLNTILGGYFGSRLMMNIREDKGYTYNISSGIDTMLYDGFFSIATEVGNAYLQDTLKAIYQEMEILQQDLVSHKELEMVQNYLFGNMLTMLDGPMNVANVFKTMVVEDLPFDTFHALENSIQHISPQRLRDLAQQYLRKEDMWEVIAGA